MKRTATPAALFVPMLTLLAGCWETHGDPIASGDADGDADADDGDPADAHPLDLLFMVDNSNSMNEEQTFLAEGFPILLDALLHPPDSNANGVSDFRRLRDLHVGVISSDMGTAGNEVQTCRDAVDGDDGILRNSPSGVIAGCSDTYEPFLSYTTGDDAAALADDFACIGILGTGGCAFEQQLKAVRSAVSAHQDDANAGFLRDDSVLAVVIVTDEEDCSVRDDIPPGDVDIFNPMLDLGPLNLRCFNYADQYLEPVATYVSDLLAVRPDHPERLVVAPIVGIPTNADCGQDMQCLLDLPDMQEVIDDSAEGKGEALKPSCDVFRLGHAVPPRRIVRVADGLQDAGAAVAVHSICQDDWTSTMESIARTIGLRLND